MAVVALENSRGGVAERGSLLALPACRIEAASAQDESIGHKPPLSTENPFFSLSKLGVGDRPEFGGKERRV